MINSLKKLAVSAVDFKSQNKGCVKSDEELMHRLVSGCHIAFNLLVTRYKQKIFDFIYFQIKHQADSEDLTQEVFLQLYKNAQNFRGDAKFSTYLYSVAKYIVFNYFRDNTRKNYTVDLTQELIESLISAEELSTDLEANKTKHDIAQAINSLAPDERQILFLCDKENFSYQQISEILDINIGTVRSRLNTVRTKLITILREQSHEL